MLVVSLSPSDYTRYGLLVSGLALLVPLVTLNVHIAPGRLLFDHTNDGKAQSSLLFTSLAGALVLATGFLVTLFPLTLLFDNNELLTEDKTTVLILLAILVLLRVIAESAATVARAFGATKAFVLLTAVQSIGLLVFYVGLRELFGASFQVLLLAYVFAGVALAGIALSYLRKHLSEISWETSLFKSALHFSAPTTVHVVALWAISSSGRWIGTAYLPLDQMAPYILTTQIVGVFGMISRAFFDAKLPEIGTAFGEQRWSQGAQIVWNATLAAAVSVVGLYAVLFVALFFLQVPVPSGYRPSFALVALAALANLTDAFYLRGVQILQGMKKTGVQAVATLISGASTVVASIILVSLFQQTGLIFATVLGFTIQAGISNLLAQRHLVELTIGQA